MPPRFTAEPVEFGYVLDLDPELGSSLAETAWQEARNASCWELLRLPAGGWKPPAELREREDLVGLLVVAGVLWREAALGAHVTFELLGREDVLRPPEPGDEPRLGRSATLTAIEPTTLVVLGAPFIDAAQRWPGLLATVFRRLENQHQRLVVQGLIGHFSRAEDRLLLTLWHLAERWGHVTAAGTRIDLTLTHELLGRLIGARRSTVTLATAKLEDRGYIRRGDTGAWLLGPGAERMVHALTSAGPSTPTLGELFAARRRAAGLADDVHALRAEARQTRRNRTKARD
jgi:CRP/FNR family transcriptional regulator, cyclic AMP receptor protein